MPRGSRFAFAFICVSAAIIAGLAATGVRAAVTNFVAPAGTAIADGNIDGVIGTEWSDANVYLNVPINPTAATAQVSLKQDNTYLYIAVVWTADIAQPWFSIEFGATGCMNNGADGALFGNDGSTQAGLGGAWSGGVGLYRDVEFGGPGSVAADAIQNGVGAIRNSGSNVMVVELKKPLNSGDAAGNDVAWAVGNTYDLLMTWDSNGGGNPGGGSANMQSTTTDSQTVQLSAVAIPEFPTTAILLVTVAGTFLLVAVGAWKRSKAKP